MGHHMSDDINSSYDAEQILPSTDHSQLPKLTQTPTAYSGCCLALSTSLLANLHAIIGSPHKNILSVGSGYGLLEALLRAEPYSLSVTGVEVEPSPNQYLPIGAHQTVTGTRFLCPTAAEANVWLFIYPRRTGLVQEYLTEHGHGEVQTIIWAGPREDWPDYAHCFQSWFIQTYDADQIGGRAWDLIAVASNQFV